MLLTPNQQRQLYRIHAIDQAEAERRDAKLRRQVRYGPLLFWLFYLAGIATLLIWVTR